MKIISVTNRKGGVGKSTMAVHIAAGMATLGGRVGLVDTDSQGHAGLMLNMPEENGLFRALVEKAPMQEVLREVPIEHYSTPDNPARGALYLLPSGNQTYKIPHELDAGDAFAFLEVLEAMGEIFNLDVIVIDTNPTMSLFDGAVYMATDGFIYVTEINRLAFDGLQKITEEIARFSKSRKRYLGRGSRIIGIIPNKMQANTVLHRESITELVGAYGELVWQPVISRIAWAECTNLSEPIYKYAPSGQEAADAWRVTTQTMEVIRQWQKAD